MNDHVTYGSEGAKLVEDGVALVPMLPDGPLGYCPSGHNLESPDKVLIFEPSQSSTGAIWVFTLSKRENRVHRRAPLLLQEQEACDMGGDC